MWQRNTRNVHGVRRIERHLTTFTKEGCAWDSRLVIVNMESLVISQSVSRIFIEEVPKAES